MLNEPLLSGYRPLGVAVSGGSDSTALLILCAQLSGTDALRAVTVDHGLRVDAQAEARQVAQLCARLKIPHDILKLDLNDGSDLQARARTERYVALSDWALQKGVDAVALGHTKDDVAEGFLMRLARGSGVDGLAAMPEMFERNGVRFVRPLLGTLRHDLQTYLHEHGLTWSEDPSNQDPRFTRVKMRQAQPHLDDLGLTTQRLSQTADWMRAASDVLETAADRWIEQNAWADHGDAVFNFNALQIAPLETAARVLSRALCNISGNLYRPRFSALSELRSSLTAQTLHGCLAYHHGETLRLTREPNAIKAKEMRWLIKGPVCASHVIKPLGEAGLRHIPNWRDTALLPRRSLLGTPAIWLGETLVAAPIARPDPNWSASTANPLHLSK